MKQAPVLLQLVLFATGIIALVFYVYPEFGVVNENQNLLQEYDEAISEASEVRDLIQRLQQERAQLPAAVADEIATYLPQNAIDKVSVQRDLLAYVQARELTLEDLSHTESLRNPYAPGVFGERFTLTVVGDYAEVKELLIDLENNDYPLRFATVSMSARNFEATVLTLTLDSYWYAPAEAI